MLNVFVSLFSTVSHRCLGYLPVTGHSIGPPPIGGATTGQYPPEGGRGRGDICIRLLRCHSRLSRSLPLLTHTLFLHLSHLPRLRERERERYISFHLFFTIYCTGVSIYHCEFFFIYTYQLFRCCHSYVANFTCVLLCSEEQDS